MSPFQSPERGWGRDTRPGQGLLLHGDGSPKGRSTCSELPWPTQPFEGFMFCEADWLPLGLPSSQRVVRVLVSSSCDTRRC